MRMTGKGIVLVGLFLMLCAGMVSANFDDDANTGTASQYWSGAVYTPFNGENAIAVVASGVPAYTTYNMTSIAYPLEIVVVGHHWVGGSQIQFADASDNWAVGWIGADEWGWTIDGAQSSTNTGANAYQWTTLRAYFADANTVELSVDGVVQYSGPLSTPMVASGQTLKIRFVASHGTSTNGLSSTYLDAVHVSFSGGPPPECVVDTDCGFCMKCDAGTCVNQAFPEDTKDECDAVVTSCKNNYQYYLQDGWCSAGSCNTNSYAIADGHVCVDATNYDVQANAQVHCGEPLFDCIQGMTSAPGYYVGYDIYGNCVNTDWASSGQTWNTQQPYYIISTTEQMPMCQEVSTVGSYISFTPISPTPYELVATDTPTFSASIDTDENGYLVCELVIDGAGGANPPPPALNGETISTTDARTLGYVNDDVWHSWWFSCYDQNTMTLTSSGDYSYFKIAICTPNWTCSDYANCSEQNVTECLAVSDVNQCGEQFGGNLADLNGVCEYQAPCTPLWHCTQLAACAPGDIQSCGAVADEHACGVQFNGSMSTYDVSCNYVAPPQGRNPLAIGGGGGGGAAPANNPLLVSQSAIGEGQSGAASSLSEILTRIWDWIAFWRR